MLFKVFAIYDSAIQAWKPPMFCRAKGEMMRWWMEMVQNVQTDLGKHPADYTLFELGTWEDDKNKFDLYKAPVSLGTAIEFVKKSVDNVSGENVSQETAALSVR